METEVSVKISALDKSQDAFKSVQKSIDTVERSTKSFREKIDSLQPTFQKMTAYGAAALGAVTYGANRAITSASNLEESINAVNVVFGESSNSILDFGRNAATSVGLSNSAFNQLATNTGTVLSNTGKSMGEVATMTTDLAVRAADLASVYNTDVDSAMNAIRSALIGQSEPLRNLGVVMSEAQTKAFALSTGIIEVDREMTEQEKTLARYNFIMQATTKQAGDFANTSEGLANKERILAAQTEDLAVKMGKVLAPIKEAVQNGLSPLIQKVGEWIELNPKLARNIVVVTGVLAGLTAAVGVLGIAFNVLMAPIGLIAVALAGLAAGVYFVVTAFKNFTNMIGLTTAKAKASVIDLTSAFADYSDPLDWQTKKVENFGNRLSTMGTQAKDAADKIKQLKEEASGIFGSIDQNEADSKRKLAETIVEQEENVSEMKSELRRLERDEDSDSNATRIRELRKTIEQEQTALRGAKDLKLQLRAEISEAERRADLSDFERKVEDIQRERVARLEAQLARLQEIQTEIQAEQMKSSAISTAFGNAQATMQSAIKTTSEIAIEEAEKMKKAFDRAVSAMSSLNIGGSSRTSMSISSQLKYTKVNDAVISPKGDVISTHPDDYLIATKNPQALAGAGTGGVTINISGTFLDDRQAARRMGDEIMTKLRQQMQL